MTNGALARTGSAAAIVGLSLGAGAFLASSLPFATRVVAAGAAAAAIFAFVIWVRRPELLIGAFFFALPLLEGREIVAGVNPGELATLIVVSLGGLSLFVERRPLLTERVTLVLWVLVGLAVVGGVSAAANGVLDPAKFATSVLKPLAWAMVIYLVVVHFDSERKLHGLLLALIASGAAVGVAAVVQFVTGHTSPAGAEGTPRADGTFEHLNQLGAFIVLLALPTLTYALATRRRSLQLLLVAAFVIQLTALLLSGTLGSLLGLLVAVLISLRVWKARPATGFALTMLPLVILVGLALLVPAQASRVYLFGNRADDRFGTYAAGLEIARDNLWLGTGSIENAVEQIRDDPEYRFSRFGEVTVQPHNVFLEAQVVMGAPGLVLLISLVWLSLRILLASRPRPDDEDAILQWGLLLGCIAFLVQNLTNTSLLHVRLGLIFLTLVTIAARLRELQGAANGPPSTSPESATPLASAGVRGV